MRDDKGFYYYPYPGNKQTRVYVKKERETIWFRLWSRQVPELWDEHGWVPYDAILKASELYQKKSNFDPQRVYDIRVAKELLEEKV